MFFHLFSADLKQAVLATVKKKDEVEKKNKLVCSFFGRYTFPNLKGHASIVAVEFWLKPKQNWVFGIFHSKLPVVIDLNLSCIWLVLLAPSSLLLLLDLVGNCRPRHPNKKAVMRSEI